MPATKVFISYSHHTGDESWKDRICTHLQSLGEHEVTVWQDREIQPGSVWYADIEQAMAACEVALLLVSPDFLTSKFIRETELPYLRARREANKLRIIPVLLEPCTWLAHDWLPTLQCWPRDNRALSSFDAHDAHIELSALALHVIGKPELAAQQRPAAKAPEPPPVRLDLDNLSDAAPDFFGRATELAELDAAWGDAHTSIVVLLAFGGTGKTSLLRHWLERLRCRHWGGARQVFGWSFFAQGHTAGASGAAQTSEDAFFAAAQAFFGVADAGSEPIETRASRLAEVIRATRTLLVLDGLEPLQQPPGEHGGALHAPGMQRLLKALAGHGQPGLCVIATRVPIEDLAPYLRHAEHPQRSVRQWRLDNLDARDGARLLHRLGVRTAGWVGIDADDAELQALSSKFHGHALTLRFVGLCLFNVHDGNVRKHTEIDFGEAKKSFHDPEQHPYDGAFAAIRAYEHWLSAPLPTGALQRLRNQLPGIGAADRRQHLQRRRQLAVLRMLGLFDRPATPDCLRALLSPPVAGLNDALLGITPDEWRALIDDLQRAGLVQTDKWMPAEYHGYGQDVAEKAMAARDREKYFDLGPAPAFEATPRIAPLDARTLDAHPLLREYFARRMSDSEHEAERKAVRNGHGRLFAHLCASVPYWPEGEAGLAPLYQAVAHGCRAGRYEEARAEVYRDRINRRAEFYATKKLGLYGTELAALAGFFAPPWRAPVTALAEGDRAWLLNEAAFDLRALGRLREAVEPMQAGLEMRVVQRNWQQAAIHASNLSELLLTLGEVRQAEAEATRAVGYADDSGDASWRMASRTAHADAGLQAGAPAAALARFAEAEALQRQRQPAYPRLYSLWGFRYCDALLLGAERAAWAARLGAALPEALCAARLAEAQAVAQRAAQTLDWAINHFGFGPLDIGLDHLTLARAALYRAWLAAPGEAGAAASAGAEATHAAAQAVEWLRKAGSNNHIPRGLLIRACVHALHGDAPAARADLDAAERIARRGDMRLHLADVHLHRARLFPAAETARADLDAARTLIDATGYERRRGELDDATAVLEGRAVVLPETESVLAAIHGENLPEPPAVAPAAPAGIVLTTPPEPRSPAPPQTGFTLRY